MVKSIYDVSFSLFGKIVKIIDFMFVPLKSKLVTANIDLNYKKYSAFIILIFIVSLMLVLLICSMISYIFLDGILVNTPIIIIISLVLSFGFAIFAYYYPFLVSDDRRARIDNQLPFISLYLSTISKSGFPPQEMFKMLSKFKTYKIISEEADRITKDTELLGIDLPSAISRAIKRSPSSSWKELLSGLKSTITIGGELGEYLEEKSAGFIQDYKRRLKKFSETVSIFMNIYITVIIVGIVFFIVISSLMSSIGGISIVLIKTVQMAVVFIGLPIVTVGFILLVRSMSPWSK